MELKERGLSRNTERNVSMKKKKKKDIELEIWPFQKTIQVSALRIQGHWLVYLVVKPLGVY